MPMFSQQQASVQTEGDVSAMGLLLKESILPLPTGRS